MSVKPLGSKAYGSIPHLPGSRTGPADRTITAGQARICTERVRDSRDRVIVQEKLDGSCCAVARIGDEIVPLTRAGYFAGDSPYLQHWLFVAWVAENRHRFNVLADGERAVGEWLAQAHGTLYMMPHDPFVVFDIMHGNERRPFDVTRSHAEAMGLPMPQLVSDAGPVPVPVSEAIARLDRNVHGAIGEIEGVVYRVERAGRVDFLAKYVRADKIDGEHLPEVSGRPELWNWSRGRRIDMMFDVDRIKLWKAAHDKGKEGQEDAGADKGRQGQQEDG